MATPITPAIRPVVNAIYQWARVTSAILPLVIIVIQAAVAWVRCRLKTANLRLRKSDTETYGTKVLSLYLPMRIL